MTTATRHGVGAAVAREIRESPMSTVVAPAALIGLAVWLLASRPAWWIGPVGVGGGTLASASAALWSTRSAIAVPCGGSRPPAVTSTIVAPPAPDLPLHCPESF